MVGALKCSSPVLRVVLAETTSRETSVLESVVTRMSPPPLVTVFQNWVERSERSTYTGKSVRSSSMLAASMVIES